MHSNLINQIFNMNAILLYKKQSLYIPFILIAYHMYVCSYLINDVN